MPNAPETTERWTQRALTEELTPEGTTVWTATIAYDVVGAPDEQQALARVPPTGADHPLYGAAMKLSYREPLKKGGDYFVVLTRYTSRVGGGTSNPLDRMPRMEWNFNYHGEHVDRDADGHAVTNSVGDVPANLPTLDHFDVQLTLYRWEPRYDVRKAVRIMNKVNGDKFTIDKDIEIEAGECKCVGYRPSTFYEQGASPLAVQYEFVFRERLKVQTSDGEWMSGWDWRFRDEGSRGYYADGDEKKLGEYVNALGEFVSEPVRLDGQGAPLSSEIRVTRGKKIPAGIGQPDGAVVDTTFREAKPPAVFLIYKRHKRTNFKGLVPNFTT